MFHWLHPVGHWLQVQKVDRKHFSSIASLPRKIDQIIWVFFVLVTEVLRSHPMTQLIEISAFCSDFLGQIESFPPIRTCFSAFRSPLILDPAGESDYMLHKSLPSLGPCFFSPTYQGGSIFFQKLNHYIVVPNFLPPKTALSVLFVYLWWGMDEWEALGKINPTKHSTSKA